MTWRILRSSRQIKNTAKAELVQKGVLINKKLRVLWVHDGGRERGIPSLYLNISGRKEVEDPVYLARQALLPSVQPGTGFLVSSGGGCGPT